MYILGINSGVRIGYRDAAAVLIKDGDIVAASEEERFNRIKGSPGQLPEQSISFVLNHAGISIKDVDIVASHGITWGDQYEYVLHDYFKANFGHAPKIERYHHHDCHSASTYYASGFPQALILSIDNSGDGVSTQISVGKGKEINVLDRIDRPNSLGLFYGLITQFCGFRRDEDEFKLMGLSSYGKPNIDLSFLVHYRDGSYNINQDFIQPIKPGQSQPMYQQPVYSDKIIDKLGLPRAKGQRMTQHYMDVAASAQQLLEDVVLNVAEKHVQRTGISKLCFAGGVALNCALNRKLMNAPFVNEIFIQPAAGDAGVSLGAAYLAAINSGVSISKMDSVYLGREYTDSEIKDVLIRTGVEYKKVDDPAHIAAELIASGKVIAWFQGRSEYGPRALGNRSILANPSIDGMRDLVNEKIKFRENFRPFCPSVLEEDARRYFQGKQFPSPFMTINYDTTTLAKEELGQIVHIDGTSRIQTVSQAQNPLYHQLLTNLKEITGHGVCINTSFNTNRQPIVNSPLEAISTFYGTGLDDLILGNFRLSKYA